MKNIKCMNSNHRRIVKRHLRFLQRRMYVMTEHDKTTEKFSQFNNILKHIVSYSNDFIDNGDSDSVDEWLYIIPNLSLYACMGFITGVRTEKLEKYIDFELELRNCLDSTLDAVGELSDMVSDIETKKQLEKDLEC